MARKTTIGDGDERIEVINPSEDVRRGTIPSAGSDVQGSALEHNPPEPEEVTPPKRFRVLADKYFQDPRGYRSLLRSGKEIDTHNYDVQSLRRQGVKLEEILPD